MEKKAYGDYIANGKEDLEGAHEVTVATSDEKQTIDIVLLMHDQVGLSRNKIAKETGLNKKTIAKILAKYSKVGASKHNRQR